jgi:adenine-specific DNA-methyltransferase
LEPNKDLLIKSSVEKKQGKRDWHILFRSREESDFATSKILVRQTADRIIAALDNEIGFYPINTVNIVKLQSEDIDVNLAVLGILNSKLITFFYQEISQEGGRILAEVKPSRVKAVPVPNLKDIKSLSKIVQKVINKKQENQDTSYEESQIDRMVYELYGLTEEEIRIVEEK